VTVAEQAWSLALGGLPVSEGLRMRDTAEVRFFPGADPARFEKLCGINDLDAFLASDGARTPRVGLADSRRDGGAGLPFADYSAGENERIDLPRVFALYDAGATIVLTHMHEILGPLARFCRGLEQIFLHPVQCNIYLTPPGAQGFHVHFDTHDVLILQVEGEKLWRTWPTPAVPFANERTPWEGRSNPDEKPSGQMLHPGDVLYVPRGTLHDAAAQGAQSSLHLTIGLLSHSWGDALRAALDLMEGQEPALRQAFPTWRLAEGGISNELVQEAAKRSSRLGTANAMELVSQKLLATLAAEQMPMMSRGVIAPVVSAADRVDLSDTAHQFVTPRPDGSAELRWAGGTLTLSAEEFDWIARISEGATAGELGGPAALAFCQKLASHGLVTVQPARDEGGRVSARA